MGKAPRQVSDADVPVLPDDQHAVGAGTPHV
ncbi:MAG: hypothetical protein K0Q89_3169, partial [Thermomicrobiales bacterium]|nr:hypothetical protein [Thermomicrobiales bacterium]